MSQPFKLVTSSMNHRPEPEFQGIWYPYTGSRMKDCYDLKLKDGTELRGWYPNACAWSSRNKVTQYDIDRVEDDDVAEIRLMTDTEIDEICYFGFTGSDRTDRNVRYFGDVLPKVIRHEDGTVTFEHIVKRVFEDPVRSSWDGEVGWWLHTDELSEEELDEAVGACNGNVEGFFKSLDKYFKRAKLDVEVTINEDIIISDLWASYAAVKMRIHELAEEKKRSDENARRRTRSHMSVSSGVVRQKSDTKIFRESDRVEKDGLTGKQRRKQEKKERRLLREQNANKSAE